ncbi:MAG: hypothetical protein HOP19_05210, partial [Acidobacteria bacterium]|nr:hypothetical protein [Acidobacteriota bacterium]
MRYHPRAPLFSSLRAAIVVSVLLLLAFHHPVHHKVKAAQPAAIAVTSAASYDVNALAPGAIVSAFGAALATQVGFASTATLPTTLAGTSVSVRDSAGAQRLAGLFFVSATQINFLIPEATASGAATITVTAGDGKVSAGTFDIKTVAPAIFTTNADGQGVPAAVVLRVKADGQQIFENVAQFDAAAGRWRPLPIDLSPAGDQVALLLFLSGAARAADTNGDGNRNESVRPLLGGVETTPLFLGPQGNFAGL